MDTNTAPITKIRQDTPTRLARVLEADQGISIDPDALVYAEAPDLAEATHPKMRVPLGATFLVTGTPTAVDEDADEEDGVEPGPQQWLVLLEFCLAVPTRARTADEVSVEEAFKALDQTSQKLDRGPDWSGAMAVHWSAAVLSVVLLALFVGGLSTLFWHIGQPLP